LTQIVDNVNSVGIILLLDDPSRWSEAEMPENETLLPDARNASRWRPIGERMDKGQSPTDAFPDI
jgi:hypothetical protein